MARYEKLLADMRHNEHGWRMSDVEAVCRGAGAECAAPRNGSHYKVKHPDAQQILTIPAAKPIKPVYIRALVTFLDGLETTPHVQLAVPHRHPPAQPQRRGRLPGLRA